MLSITINGIAFELLSDDELREYEPDKVIDLPALHLSVVLDGKDREQLYRAAGYNVTKIDFAVPIAWRRQPLVASRIEFGDCPAWSYETDTLMGSPIWDSEMYQRLNEIIITLVNQIGDRNEMAMATKTHCGI
jgi:hypothetical protein